MGRLGGCWESSCVTQLPATGVSADRPICSAGSSRNDGGPVVSPLREQLLLALDHKFRTTADVAQRAGMMPSRAAPALGTLRRLGWVEWRVDGRVSSWRLPSADRDHPRP